MSNEASNLTDLLATNYGTSPWGRNAREEDQASAILSAYILIPKAELPSIELCGCSGSGLFMKGECWDGGTADTSIEAAWGEALERIAHWNFIASGLAKEQLGIESRNRRRDELAQEFSTECDASQSTYSGSNLMFRRAIDRIIELEASK